MIRWVVLCNTYVYFKVIFIKNVGVSLIYFFLFYKLKTRINSTPIAEWGWDNTQERPNIFPSFTEAYATPRRLDLSP